LEISPGVVLMPDGTLKVVWRTGEQPFVRQKIVKRAPTASEALERCYQEMGKAASPRRWGDAKLDRP
jgi:hypothetical protein